MPFVMWKFLEEYCCCKGEHEDDNERLIRAEEEGDWPRNANSTRHLNNNGINSYGHIGAGTSSARANEAASSQPQVKTQDEVEEDALNKILDRTQQSIIDVSNLDNNTLDIDVVKRARLYEKAVKRHDAAIEKRKSSFNGVLEEPIPKTQLLVDVGSRIQELLSHPFSETISAEEMALLSRAGELFHGAFRAGSHIECREELVAYMSLDD